MSVRWHIRTQAIPLHSVPTIRSGSWCAVGEPLATIDHLPGNLRRLDAARELGVSAQQLPQCMVKTSGAAVSSGDIIALSNTFGFPLLVRSTVSGTLAQVSSSLGWVYIRQHGAALRDDLTVDLSDSKAPNRHHQWSDSFASRCGSPRTATDE